MSERTFLAFVVDRFLLSQALLAQRVRVWRWVLHSRHKHANVTPSRHFTERLTLPFWSVKPLLQFMLDLGLLAVRRDCVVNAFRLFSNDTLRCCALVN